MRHALAVAGAATLAHTATRWHTLVHSLHHDVLLRRVYYTLPGSGRHNRKTLTCIGTGGRTGTGVATSIGSGTGAGAGTHARMQDNCRCTETT